MLEFAKEITMLEIFIKFFFILITAIYTFYKLLNRNPKNKYVPLILTFLSATTSAFIFLLLEKYPTLSLIILFCVFFLIMLVTEKLPAPLTYITTLFAFAFSYIILTISIILASVLLSPFYYQNYDISWPVIQFFIGIIQFILLYFCFHIPRLQKGMTFLYNVPSGNIGSTLCVVFITIILIAIQTENATVPYMSVFFFLILLSSILFICWWNYHITQTYKKFLRKNELDSLNLLLEEKNQEIVYLRNENDKLARIIHKDNKIIPALSMAMIDSYEHESKLDLNVLKSENDSALHVKLKQLYEERLETLEKYQQEIMHLPQTAFDSVNAILTYMQTQSLKENIPYQIILFDDLSSTIPAEITEEDFTHILGDLLDNAINACKNISSASIQIYLGKMDGISTIKICNTGNIFNIETLKNLSLTRHTTHADTGGSGIGLMDIWKIKELYDATLLIDEMTNGASPHTCMNILFNHKKHYIIQSDRHKELSTYINRPDVMILAKD